MKKVKIYFLIFFIAFNVYSNDVKILDYLDNNFFVEKLQLDWEMQKRFGVDKNGDGKIDIPNSYAYVNPETYNATVFLSGDGEVLRNLLKNRAKFFWTVSDEKGNIVFSKEENNFSVKISLPLGEYSVKCDIEKKGVKSFVKGKIILNDILIACLGDSYSSGEGAPEFIWGDKKPSLWSDGGGNHKASLEHIRAHRSSLSWGPQAALFLENFDRRSSITFVFLPISGAMLDRGLLGEKPPLDSSYGEYNFISQLQELKDIAGKREIEQIWMSIGGNDLSAVATLTMLLLLGPADMDKELEKNFSEKYLADLQNIKKSVEEGVWDDNVTLVKFFKKLGFSAFDEKRVGLNNLPKFYKEVADKINKLKVKEVCMLEYPCPVTAGTSVANSFLKGFRVGPYETAFMVENFFDPLLQKIKDACTDNGWHYIPLADVNYSSHTLEKRLPYPPHLYKGNEYIKENIFPTTWEYFKNHIKSRDVRWFRNEGESIVVQGSSGKMEKPTVFSTNGTFHPNEFGYQALMHALLKYMPIPKNYPDFKYIYD